MFEEKYRKYYQDIAPSDALNEETLALMAEARDHLAAAPKPLPRRRSLIWIPIAATAVAAMVAVVIVGGWLRGDTYNDLAGNADDVFSDSMGTELPDETPPADGEGEQQENNSSAPNPEVQDTPTPPADENQSDPSEGNNSASKPNTENKGESKDEDATKDEDDSGEEQAPPDNNAAAAPSDPYAPVIKTDKKTTTYLTIREFLNGLAKKETPGYGKKYYNARELIIVPSLLPDGARFRHLYLNNENGKYSYSYLFTNGENSYIIDVEVNAKTPKTLRDLNLQKGALEEEEVLTGKKENHLYYLFGGRDEVTVTLKNLQSETDPNEDETATLLEQFKLERCSLENTVIDMKY